MKQCLDEIGAQVAGEFQQVAALVRGPESQAPFSAFEGWSADGCSRKVGEEDAGKLHRNSSGGCYAIDCSLKHIKREEQKAAALSVALTLLHIVSIHHYF